ncbi:MAG: sigma-70 family RNA polymerase sigma factor [bacterium]|nr:sigma-70 family RNA polymerase sigma factor [bacterium]
MDENKIIQTCLAGDVDAFEKLVEHYQSRVIALAWNILGDHDDARDAAQDAFIQAYKNLHRYDSQWSFKTWLMGITVKRSLDRIRKQKSFLKFFKYRSETMREETRPTSHSIEQSEIFNPLLKLLNERERTALCLKVNEGYSAREIGALLNCSETTARVHLFKAKKKLKKALLTNLVRCSNDM